MRLLVAVTAVLLVAAIGDLAVEMLAGSGLLAAPYHDVGHQALGAPIDAAALFLVLVGSSLLFERRGALPLHARLQELRTLARRSTVHDTLLVASLAFGVSLCMEAVEKRLGGGSAFGGFPLTGAGGVAAFGVFCLLSAATIATIHRFLRALVVAFEVIAVRVVATFRRWRCTDQSRLTSSQERQRAPRCNASLLATRCFGNRAPPASLSFSIR